MLRRAAWVALGLVLVLGSGAISLLSGRFAYEASALHSPVHAFVATMSLLGLAYLTLLWLVPRTPSSRTLLIWVLVVGALMRGVLAFSTPIYEDDYYRYLWEGGLVANGLNPYRYAPNSHDDADAPRELKVLGQDAGMVVERVNHPYLTTIYPPLAQAAFAFSYWLEPFSLNTWRLVVLGAEAAGLGLLLLILGRLGRSPLWSAIYWWNPLVTKEFANSAHMDALLVPLLLAVLLLCLRGQRRVAAGALALAAAVKVWPVLLLPLVVYDAERPLGRMLQSIAVFVVLVAALTFPQWLNGLEPGTGLGAYSRTWQINDAGFMAISTLVAGVSDTLGLGRAASGALTRVVVGTLLVVLAVVLARLPGPRPIALARGFMWMTAALFLLMPAQFPWYFSWALPFLALVPRLSVLLLTALLPLYYLRFYYVEAGSVAVFDFGIVWLEYVPVWTLLVLEWWRQRAAARASTPWMVQGAS